MAEVDLHTPLCSWDSWPVSLMESGKLECPLEEFHYQTPTRIGTVAQK